jgi:hypothetical protein
MENTKSNVLANPQCLRDSRASRGCAASPLAGIVKKNVKPAPNSDSIQFKPGFMMFNNFSSKTDAIRFSHLLERGE